MLIRYSRFRFVERPSGDSSSDDFVEEYRDGLWPWAVDVDTDTCASVRIGDAATVESLRIYGRCLYAWPCDMPCAGTPGFPTDRLTWGTAPPFKSSGDCQGERSFYVADVGGLPHPTTLLVVRVQGVTTVLHRVVTPWDEDSDLMPSVGSAVRDGAEGCWIAPPGDGYYICRAMILYAKSWDGEDDAEAAVYDWSAVDPEDLAINGADGVLSDVERDNQEAMAAWPCLFCGMPPAAHDPLTDACPPKPTYSGGVG